MPIVPSWVVLVKILGKKKRLCRKQVGGKGLRWARSEGAKGCMPTGHSCVGLIRSLRTDERLCKRVVDED